MSLKDFFTSEPTPEILELSKAQVVQSRRELQTAIDNLSFSRNQSITATIEKGELLMKANEVQVGGDHYRKQAIQPWDAVDAWGLGFHDGNAVKYLARWRAKNGIQDLRKAQHYITKQIELEKRRLLAAGLPIPNPDAADVVPPVMETLDDLKVSDADEKVDKEITDMAERLSKPAPVQMPKPKVKVKA